MWLFKKKKVFNLLKRADFINLVSSDRIWMKELSIDEIKSTLNVLASSLSNYEFMEDKYFIMNPRRKVLKSMIVSRIGKAQPNDLETIRECMFNFWEYVGDEYFGNYQTASYETGISVDELTKMDDQYRNKGIISLQEKDEILEMINIMLNYIN